MFVAYDSWVRSLRVWGFYGKDFTRRVSARKLKRCAPSRPCGAIAFFFARHPMRSLVGVLGGRGNKLIHASCGTVFLSSLSSTACQWVPVDFEMARDRFFTHGVRCCF